MAAPAARWRARLTTLEAMALLVVARTLVRAVAFRRWRNTLGARVPAQPTRDGGSGRLDVNLPARRLARAVERAAARLPRASKCLPQAMALQWMLRRRRIGGTVRIGVRTGQAPGTLDDLHAWVTRGGEVLIGDSDGAHCEIYVADAEVDRG